MNRLNFRRLAYQSFGNKFLKGYFSTSIIIKAFLIAFCLSSFIYLEFFSLHVKALDSILALIGFALLLFAKKEEMFWSGFFIGIFWFYWISLSFIHYELSYLIPLVIIGVAFIYGVLFLLVGVLTPHPIMRILGILAFSFIEPFGFNWLKPELVLINSYYSPEIYSFALLLVSLYLLHVKQRYSLLGVLGLIALLFYPNPPINSLAPLNIEVVQTSVSQEIKWKKEYQSSIFSENFTLIQNAIEEKKDLIILPESAFPTYLNYEPKLVDELKALSLEISILTGALSWEEKKVYNSAYLFDKGEMHIAHKYLLVPFGEQIPLPKFARDFINKIFFNGAEDYESAKAPHDFEIKGIKFRNAICFEATKDALFQNNPRFMLAMSNNAWFTPSIEPTLQNLLLKYYARKYNTTIYHSANGGISEVIK